MDIEPEGKRAKNIIAIIHSILSKYPKDIIKSIEIQGYEELGEFAGEAPFPKIKVELKD